MTSLPDQDRGLQLAATFIAGAVITLVFVGGRLISRWSIAGVGVDDFVMLLTWLAFIPLTILICMFSFDGGTRHIVYLQSDPAHLKYVQQLNWIAQAFAIFCLGSGKVAVALLIIRLLHRASFWRRYSLYVTCGWVTINTFLMILLTYVQCENPAALWDEELKLRTKCWNPDVQSNFSIYGAVIFSIVDFYLAFLPVTLVWGLKTDLRKRIALIVLLGCGSLTGICAAIKASKLISLSARSDFTWETYGLFLWTGIEIILSIVCGSIPALKPIYAICMGRRTMSLRSSQKITHGTPRRTYEHQDDAAIALAPRQASSTMTAERASEEEIALAETVDSEKNMRAAGIHVTRTVRIS